MFNSNHVGLIKLNFRTWNVIPEGAEQLDYLRSVQGWSIPRQSSGSTPIRSQGDQRQYRESDAEVSCQLSLLNASPLYFFKYQKK